MNPVIQMTVAVAMVVIAARMWPPIIYWLAGLFFLLFTIKGIRRCCRWARTRPAGPAWRLTEIVTGFIGMIAIASLVDYLHPMKISAVSIFLCISCALIIIGLLLSAADRIRR